MTKPDVGGDVAVGVASKGRGIERFAAMCFFALAFLLPIFFVPELLFPLQFSKALLLSALVLVAFCLWVVARLKDGRFVIPFPLLFFTLFVIVGLFALSSLLSASVVSSLFGQSLDVGTTLNMLILSLFAFLVAVLFRAKEQIFASYLAFLASFLLVALFHVLRLFFGPDFLSLGIFTETVSNTVGKWNDLGVFFGVSTLLSLITVEFLSLNWLFKALIYISLALSLLFLAIVNFSMVWFVIGLFSLVFLVYIISFNPSSGKFEGNPSDTLRVDGEEETASSSHDAQPLRRVPIPSLVVLLISVIFVMAGNTLGNQIGSALHISQIEVRPSWSATFEVARQTLVQSPLLGSGPNQFTSEWLKYKPDGVNGTVFWNVDFNYGIGLIPTLLATTGILGVLAWVVFFLLFLYAGFKAILSDFSDAISRYLITSSFLVALFLWIFTVFYIPSLTIFFLAFFFTGLFVASLTISRMQSVKIISFVSDPRAGFVSVLLLILFLVGGVTLGYALTQKYAAAVFFQQGVAAFNTEGNLDKSEKLITQAVSLSPSDLSYRLLTELNLVRMNAVLNKKPGAASVESVRAEFQTLLGAALLNARQAVAQGPENYENLTTLGRVYEAVVPLKIEGAYENARTAYTEALALNPKSPAIHLTMARLEVAKGDNGKARENISLALKEKNNYTEAIFLLSQIDAAEGNIKAAISSAEAASTFAPNDSSVFFQLGILKFTDKDYRGATKALEQAVAINPVYANAKYFLGLSYGKLGRAGEAIKEFTELKTTNPDNKEIDLILANLNAGRDPFSNAAPPVDATPEKRSKLPVSEKGAAKTRASGLPQDEE